MNKPVYSFEFPAPGVRSLEDYHSRKTDQKIAELRAQREAQLLDMFLVVLCGPFGRARRELEIPYEDRLDFFAGKLSEVYP